ncbi:hypothetical protein WOC76_21735 [Methylocystis sp. IM3]|uniref:hypothetical protein n=1 Tax=unclassified Methylocystis TaxID=2625913 RepID=UPI0030FBDD96
MFDVYQNKANPTERVVVIHSSPLPAIFPMEKWAFLGSVSSVSANIGSYVSDNGFYIYRTSIEFKKGEAIRHV